jgi:hypothetical protein
MFDKAGLVSSDQQQSRLQQANAGRDVVTAVAPLRQPDVPVAVQPGGVPLLVPVDKVLGGGFEARQFELTLWRLMQDKVPVSLSLTGLRAEGSDRRCATEVLRRFCEHVRAVLSRVAYEPARLSLCVHSHQLPLQAFFLIANATLGVGPRYVYLDGLQMRRQCNSAVQAVSEQNWHFLWQQRGSCERVLPVYGGLVRSACPLLSDEVATTILPGTATVVPAGSAWLSLELRLGRFADADGRFDWRSLSATIVAAVRASEKIHDGLAWPYWRQLADAKLHRRLAICVTGLGDLVLQCGHDPADLHCLTWLGSIIMRVRRELHLASAVLAREHGALPAVLRNDPSCSLSPGPTRDNWRRHWQSAVRTSALRHRNMLVLSPYSVFPESADNAAACADLLPVIRHADAWCFSTTQTLRCCNLADYRRFHQRAWAVIQGHNEGCAVAAGV